MYRLQGDTLSLTLPLLSFARPLPFCLLSCPCIVSTTFAPAAHDASGGANVVGEVLSIVRYLWGSLRVHLKVRVGGGTGGGGGGGCLL